jgi:pyruvate formate lyase activating enzyme
VGTYYSAEGLTELLLRDYRYYGHSGGGVTLSGGECTFFPDYLEILLKRLKERNVSVVLQTCGHFSYHIFATRLLPHIDMVYFDIKFLDGETHKKFTGRSNRLILENFVRLVKLAPDRVHTRVPLVPGVTATEENLTAIFRFLRDCGMGSPKLLPYNPLGIDKYLPLGRNAPDLPFRFLTKDEEKEAQILLNEQFALD